MSNPNAYGRRPKLFPTLPKGEVLGSYDSYDDALGVVDRLAKAEFPVKEVSIVGSDLRTVERVTGTMSYGKAAVAGAASGAWFGLFLGLFMLIFDPATSFMYLGAAVLIGAGFGMLFGIVSYALNKRRRDFTSTHQVIAARYEVVVNPEHLMRAQQVLEQSPAE